MPRDIKISRALFLCAIALPPCLTAALILKYGVDFPFEDQWALARLFAEFKEGTLTLGRLFAQQNEYRQFFPNLVIVGLGWLTRWDVRYEMFFSLLLAALISFNVYRLGKLTFAAGGVRRRVAFLVSNLLIFSPVQHLNWLMGEQIVYFFPAACVTTCLVVAYSGMGVWKRFALCALLSAVSTFSSANGIFCWALIFPALVWGGGRVVGGRARLWLALSCAAGFALCAALYFHDYRRPADHPSPFTAFENPVRAAAHFLSLLGSTLAGESALTLPVAVAAGALLLALYAAFAVRAYRGRADHAAARRVVGWLMLGGYSLLTAATVTVGRSAMGVAQASSSRYTTFTLYLIVALLHLVALSPKGEPGRARARGLASVARLATPALVVMLSLHALACVIAVQQMGLLRTRLLQAKACQMFVNALPDTACFERHLLPKLPALRRWSNALDPLGFWRPGLVRSNRVEEFAAATSGAPGDYGSFDSLVREGDTYRAAGRAMLPHRGEPADAVLLAFERVEGAHVAFAHADVKNRGYVFIRFWRAGPRQDPGWEKSFRADELPPGASRLTAWAFDAETGKAFKLAGAHEIGGTR